MEQNRSGAQASPIKERTVDLLVDGGEALREDAGHIRSRIEQLASRLGYHAPKDAQEGSKLAPAPNSPLDRLGTLYRDIQSSNADALRLLTEIEKHI